MNELSIIFKNLNTEVPFKSQESFSNGFHVYAFYLKVKLSDEI